MVKENYLLNYTAPPRVKIVKMRMVKMIIMIIIIIIITIIITTTIIIIIRMMMVLMVAVLITMTIMKEERAAAYTKCRWISSEHNVQLMLIYKTNV